jgi:RNA polymerase sigma-70 factor (ECF subfamily)
MQARYGKPALEAPDDTDVGSGGAEDTGGDGMTPVTTIEPQITLSSDGPSKAELSRVIARAKHGDSNAIHWLYVNYSDNVYGYARSILRDEHEAEDIRQQVFARLITSIGRYEERAVPFSAWLLRVTHNMAIDHLRRRRPILCEEARAIDERAEDRGRELSEALTAALQELPDIQRDVIVLRHVAGYSPSEIAERLGKSEDSIHGLHHRGRRALKQSLKRLDAVPVTA